MNDDLFHIDILDTVISFKSKENREYMEQIISILKEKTNNTQSKLKIKDPLKCSILTSLFLVDEIMKSQNNTSILLENHIERLVQNLNEALE
ncbi:cell division protein ZapA [Thiospirochaeta perfilievii]|uniref:Cell division protein ZapA n=1 Tax=Thiospirochaeta perfilievii TaxID=252967 RepID=A0A5C1QF64_9SPIO|nr:cell division protein ZapA [Thiospirochaeta perfilievii]QEN05760.1 cell division protein ZapA [Thiospirochaeta perfilievii]